MASISREEAHNEMMRLYEREERLHKLLAEAYERLSKVRYLGLCKRIRQELEIKP